MRGVVPDTQRAGASVGLGGDGLGGQRMLQVAALPRRERLGRSSVVPAGSHRAPAREPVRLIGETLVQAIELDADVRIWDIGAAWLDGPTSSWPCTR